MRRVEGFDSRRILFKEIFLFRIDVFQKRRRFYVVDLVFKFGAFQSLPVVTFFDFFS